MTRREPFWSISVEELRELTLSADERRGRLRGKFVLEMVLSGGNLLAAELEEGDRLVEILQAMLAESGEHGGATSRRWCVAETTIWPP